VEKLTPDIVLMDVSMPKRDGVAAAEEIGERWPDVRVIFITGTNAGTTLRRLTGRDYIRKGSPHAGPPRLRPSTVLFRHGWAHCRGWTVAWT
jgi:CheY-like chemotaxis protein